MYEEKKLRAALAEKETTPRRICLEIGMNERTFYRRMRDGKWNTAQVRAIHQAAGFSPETTCDIFLT